MSSNLNPVIRCAIYTRKSSEEGLEKSFNSLDAQREACQAYIASQRHEGWRNISKLYDDGGYSGGNMERPAFKRLMEDVAANKVDTIVVYKVDRLTRSLPDFAKIVEVFDARGASFVSVTQQFNTTTSMGRLTLNILLSFAQFEREVAGERIRDKVAASKRKGMWMGGSIPLGYDVKERKLVVNEEESKLVNEIYRRYLELGSVLKLKAYLDQRGMKSKKRVSSAGRGSGGVSFLRGALYLILQNPTYVGEVRHQKQSYRGEHQAIISRELWDRVQDRLRSDNGGRKDKLKTNCSSMLLGLLQDGKGNRFHSSHTVKNGKRYRYYFSGEAAEEPAGHGKAIRLPAYDVERQVLLRLESFFHSTNDVVNGLTLPEDHPEITQQLLIAAEKQAQELSAVSLLTAGNFVRRVIRRIVVHVDKMEVELGRNELRAIFIGDASGASCGAESQQKEMGVDDSIRLTVEARLRRCGKEMRLVVSPDSSKPQIVTPILKAVARAHEWREAVLAGDVSKLTMAARRMDLKWEYLRRILGCAFLAPDILEAILDGHYPSDLNVRKLTLRHFPLEWAEQRRQLGFPDRQCQGMR